MSKPFCFISSSRFLAHSVFSSCFSSFYPPPPHRHHPLPDSVPPCLWARQVKTVGAADRIRLSGRFNHKLPVANKACGCNYYTGSQSHLGPARLGETSCHAEREQTEAMGRGKNWSVRHREFSLHTINRRLVQQGKRKCKDPDDDFLCVCFGAQLQIQEMVLV